MTRRILILAASTLVLAACGGSGTHGASPVPVKPAPAIGSAARASVTIRVTIPRSAAHAFATKHARTGAKPQYISSAVKLFVIENASSTQAIATIDVSAPGAPGSPCSAPAADGSIRCTSAANFPVGTAVYTFYETLESSIANNLIAGVLATSRFAVTINPPGSPNIVDATLGGVPASATLAIPAPPQRGIAGSVPITVTTIDAGGSIIVGNDPFVDAKGNPGSLTVTDANPSATTGLVVDGRGAPAATVTLKNPSDTLAFTYDGKLRKATLGIGVTGVVDPPPNTTLFAPGVYQASYHLTPATGRSTALSPAYDGSATIAIGQDNGSAAPPSIATLDASLNFFPGAYAFDSTFTAPGGMSALYPAYPDPTVGYVAYGSSSLATYNVAAGTTTTTPYRVAASAQGIFDVTNDSTGFRARVRTADGTVWFAQGSNFGVPFVRPNGDAGFVPTASVVDFACVVGDEHVFAVVTTTGIGHGAAPLASTVMIDAATATATSSPQYFPPNTFQAKACSESYDRKSLWLATFDNNGQFLHLVHDTFTDPNTLAGLHVEDLGIFDNGSSDLVPLSQFIPGNEASGDTALYSVHNSNTIVRYDTSILAAQAYRIPNGDAIRELLAHPVDGNIWFSSYSPTGSSAGFLQVHS